MSGRAPDFSQRINAALPNAPINPPQTSPPPAGNSPTSANSSLPPANARLAVRAAALLIALLPATLLVVASRLEPSHRGLGTHQQLGLPPCTMRLMFDLRCPMCGMTTSWAHFTTGSWISSARVNLGGFCLALLASGVIIASVYSLWTARVPGPSVRRAAAFAFLATGAITAADWLFRLVVEYA